MAPFNADFWEIAVASEYWDRLATEDGMWHEADEDVQARVQRSTHAENLMPAIQAAIDEVLTDKQKQVISLYFFRERNQRQIAEELNISQQAVSQHLHGTLRNGRTVGGAIRKLRKACHDRGIRWRI